MNMEFDPSFVASRRSAWTGRFGGRVGSRTPHCGTRPLPRPPTPPSSPWSSTT